MQIPFVFNQRQNKMRLMTSVYLQNKNVIFRDGT